MVSSALFTVAVAAHHLRININYSHRWCEEHWEWKGILKSWGLELGLSWPNVHVCFLSFCFATLPAGPFSRDFWLCASQWGAACMHPFGHSVARWSKWSTVFPTDLDVAAGRVSTLFCFVLFFVLPASRSLLKFGNLNGFFFSSIFPGFPSKSTVSQQILQDLAEGNSRNHEQKWNVSSWGERQTFWDMTTS